MSALALLFFSLGWFGLSRIASADCHRQYVPNEQIRLVAGRWEIGSGDPWKPLACDPRLDSDFLDGANRKALRTEGEAHLGKSAAFVFFPTQNVLEGVDFQIEVGDLFGRNRETVSLPGLGRAFLDRRVYREFQTEISGLAVHIHSEPANPAKDAAARVIAAMTARLPHATEAVRRKGTLTLVLARNATENFKPRETVLPNGIHDGEHLFAVLFSQDGIGTFENSVLEHSFHEIGSLFQIPDRYYAKGLSWMMAYDQMLKQAATESERKAYLCLDLGRVIGNLRDTIKQEGGDGSHTLEFYLDLLGVRGWPIYAWGSAFYWEKINLALEDASLPDLYGLTDAIYQHGLPTVAGQDLDRLIAAYPSGVGLDRDSKTFRALVTRYFRGETLSTLLDAALAEQVSLACT